MLNGRWLRNSLRLAPSPHFGKGLRFEPSLNGSGAQANSVSDLCLLKALAVKGHHLLIAVVALCAPRQTRPFIAWVWCGFPGGERKRLCTLYECLPRNFRDFSTESRLRICAYLRTAMS